MNDDEVKALLKMAHSPVKNYVVPGLTSSLIGGKSEHGTIRLFEASREQQEAITPHSHRFDFTCRVLAGLVVNRVWRRGTGDWFQAQNLTYSGEIGKYEIEASSLERWTYDDRKYAAGETYSMKADQVHSIYFSRGTKVLFLEGPTVSDSSIALEPYVGGEVIQTLEVKPWMFKRN